MLLLLAQLFLRAHCLLFTGSNSESQLKKVKKVLKSAVHVAYSLSLEASLLYDSCCTYLPSTLQRQQIFNNEAAPAYFRLQKHDTSSKSIVPLSSSPFIAMMPVPIFLLGDLDMPATSRRIWKTWLHQSRPLLLFACSA